MTLVDLTAIIGALGGIELIKFFANRSSDKRINNAHASTEEFTALKAQNEYLTKLLNEWIARYDDQTRRLRTTQDTLFEAERRAADKDLRIAYLQFWRCEDANCPSRKPPGRLLHGLVYSDGVTPDEHPDTSHPEPTQHPNDENPS
jgi:hypothetical protein